MGKKKKAKARKKIIKTRIKKLRSKPRKTINESRNTRKSKSRNSILENLATNRKHSNYKYEIQKKVITIKKKNGRRYKVTSYVNIPITKFEAGKYYKIYLIHKKSKDRRLLGFGNFYNIPFVSKLTGKQLAGYAFKPTKGKAPKGWVKTTKLYKTIQKELEDAAKESGADIRASLIPVRKYYHPKYMIFSDYKVKLSDKPKIIGVSVLMQFNYGFQNWLNKRVVFIDMRDEFRNRRIAYKDLYKHIDEIEEVINASIRLNFVSVIQGQADIGVVAINGFIPTTFTPKTHISPFGRQERNIIK